LPSAIGVGLKLSSIALNSVHAPADAAEDEPLGSEDRSATLEVALTARFTAALFTALTALFTALLGELLITRKLPLARDTSAKPTARDKTPNQIRHLLRTSGEATKAFNRDVPEATWRGPCVSMR
jgi:hypothetical protein